MDRGKLATAIVRSMHANRRVWQRRATIGAALIAVVACAGLMWQTGNDRTVALGNLMAYWKFDETSGSSLADASGNSNTGTTTASPTPSTDVPATSFPDNRSLILNGSTQYASAPSSSTTNFTGSFTISFWMNPAAWNNASSAGIVSKKYDNPSAQAGYVIYDDGSTTGCGGGSCQPYLNMRMKGTANNYDYLYSASAVTTGSWQHWAAVYDASGQTFKWYKNGVLDKTYTSINAGDMTNATNLLIGQSQNWSGFYNGKLDELRMYNRALSSTEVGTLGGGSNVSATWTGAASSSDWGTAANWSTGIVPDAATEVTITTRSIYPKLTQAVQASSLTVNSGTYFNLNGFNLSLSNSTSIINHGTVISKNSETTPPVTSTDGTVMYTNTANATGLKLGNTYNNLIVNDGLLGLWKLDEATPSTVTDASGYANTMNKLSTVPTASTDVPAVNFADPYSTSFNGSSDTLAIADNGNFSSTGDVTLSAWVKFNTVATTQTIAGKWRVGVSQQYLLQLNGNGKLAFWTGDGSNGATDNLESASTLSTGTWYHVTGVVSGGTKYLYVNGTLSSSHAASAYGIPGVSTPWTIGGKLSSGGSYFEYLNGLADDVRVYGRALSGTEIGRLGTGDEPATAAGTSTLGAAVTVNGNLVLNSGGLDVSASNYGVNVAGDFENNGGVFTPRSGTVTLTGADQTINSSNTFYNLTKDLASGTSTLYFGGGSTTTINGTMHMSGSGVLALNSTKQGRQWKLQPNGTVTYATGQLQDSNNLGSPIKADGIANGGGNTGWNLSAPQAPDSLAPTALVNGSYTGGTPTANFNIVDGDTGDTSKYRIQIDDTADFSSPVVDYTSALAPAATTARSFTVGQATSGGTYTAGTSSQTLSNGSYYWRVQAIDSGARTSAYTTANSGAIAFRVDATAPTAPGTPSTSSPTAINTPTWTWTAGSDSGSGLANPAYTVQWSQSSSFASGITTDTANTASFTQPSSLADGTWYFRVKTNDVAGNSSSYSANGSVYINSQAIQGASSLNGDVGVPLNITDLQISGSGNPTVPVKLLVSGGTLSMTTTTGLTFTGGSSGSTLYFSGTLSDVNTALTTLRYSKTGGGTGTDTLEVSLVNQGEVFFTGSNHLYEYVSATTTWGQADTAAKLRSKYGATGYLTTITSQEENDFVAARLTNAGWMGASDVTTESVWKWVEGPENGTTFSNGNTPSMTAAPGQYQNWNNGEPNDSGSNEDCGQFLSGGTGKWNDLPCSGTTLPGYVVEYGASGNMPLVPAKNVTLNINDGTPPTNPGTPSVSGGSPTTDNTATFSWTGSTDGGSGLRNPAYDVQWSQSATFASGVNNTSPNTAAYTTSALADGTWYFRVRAVDAMGNVSAWQSSSVQIDTTAPTAPGTPTTASPTNTKKPTWTWSASNDVTVGLASPAYTVQWSQSATFASGNSSATAASASFTQPSDLTDGTWYFRVKAADALANATAYTAAGSVVIDTVSPTLPSAPSAGQATTSSITIGWTTSKPTSAFIRFGASTGYGSQSAVTDSSPMATSHSITLPGLLTCTTYHYQTVSTDASGNIATSADDSFTTAGCAGSAEVLTQTATAVPHTQDASLSLMNTGNAAGTGIDISTPANASTDDATLQVKHIDPVAALGSIGTPTGLTVAGGYTYDIKLIRSDNTAITSFNKPITLTITYKDSDITGLVETSLVIARWDDGSGWQKLDNCRVDSAANTVTCTTTGFSTFGLFSVPTPHTAASKPTSAKKSTVADAPAAEVTTLSTPVSKEATVPTTTVLRTASSTPRTADAANARYIIIGSSLTILLMGALWWFIAAARRRRKDEDNDNA